MQSLATQAAAFAARFGLPNIMSFDGGRCLHPALPTTEAATAFLTANAERDPPLDVYFCPADLRDGFVGKPTKGDCLGATWAWVDLDPPKGMLDPQALAAWQEATLAEVDATDLPAAQLVISSGRGLWLFWRLPRRLPADEVEAINYALASRFGGGDACHNIDRVARLPFTVNSKTDQLATILRDEVGCTQVEALPRLAPPDAASEAVELGDLGTPSPLADEDAFRAAFEALPCDQAKRLDLLLSALNPAAANDFRDKPLNVRDRSAVMYSWAIKATMAGMEPSVIRDCLLSPAVPAISAHLLDPKKYRPAARVRAATRQVARAHAWALANGWQPPGAVEAQEQAEVQATGLISLAPVPTDLPARPWLVENLLMDGQVTMVSGRGGDGKSLLALQLAVMVAARVEFGWWHPRERRNVLVLNAEDNIDEQRRRLLGACDVMGVDPRLLEGRLFTMDRETLVLVHRDPADGAVKTSKLYDRLAELIEQHSIGLVVIDPLVEAHINLDENSNADMKELVLMLRRLARQRAIPLLIVHHSRKGATSGDQDGARGGSALVNACRVVVTVERMSADEHGGIRPPEPKERYIRVTGAKANYAGRIGDRRLELVPVELPNGDETPGFRRVVFGEVGEGFDVRTWEHREELLRLVRDGRGDGKLWSSKPTGPRAARLDAEISQRFCLDAKQAKDVLARFRDAGLIALGEQKGDDRKMSEVWVLPGTELPEGTAEIPF
ncbi:AAA family ATPase [Altererythrobacter lauratis]|uniref:AAA family ATPase n=1 Tax=Alteraurantiacibacter lauratis TaxID=2054627 RepID=A0ABV7EDA2_9SPHN